jgi:cephalosporin hydroxylase
MRDDEKKIVDDFNNLYHLGTKDDGSIYQRTKWMGVPCYKCPLDMWMYHEILNEVKPDLIIETGTFMGGSALYMANLCDLFGSGEIVTIDIEKFDGRPEHDRITYITGSSGDKNIIENIFAGRKKNEKVLVILDSDHSMAHVSKELEAFSPYVSVGSYMIVEDTNLNGHPTYASHGPGPFEAVEKFIESDKSFEIDKSREIFLMTFNPSGYLKKIS